MTRIILLALGAMLAMPASAALPAPGTPGAPNDPRYAGEPQRDAQGRIKRSKAALRQFIDTWPCPSTGKSAFPCPGWQVDHVVSLACGGADVPANMMWLPNAIKTGPGVFPKDRWERKVYCRTGELVPMPERLPAQ